MDSMTYCELRDAVARLAGALRKLGVEKGDRVILYLPMVPEAVIAMLACARIGAIHSVVFGGFAARELATRIDDAQPKVVLSASCGIEPNRVVHSTLMRERLRCWLRAGLGLGHRRFRRRDCAASWRFRFCFARSLRCAEAPLAPRRSSVTISVICWRSSRM